jgi:hypothetical protein
VCLLLGDRLISTGGSVAVGAAQAEVLAQLRLLVNTMLGSESRLSESPFAL